MGTVMSLETKVVGLADLADLIANELAYFDSDEQRVAFSSFQIQPLQVTQTWQYSDETHICFVIARSKDLQIVYCPTGFGPSFPWSVQRLGTMDLGMDGEWQAYLYESFVGSRLWQGPTPADFMLMGPGERAKT